MMQPTEHAVVCGHLSLDMRPELRSGTAVIQPGKLIEIGPLHASCGGAVFNTGVALHRLGVSTKLIGKLGSDEYGRMAQRMIGAYGETLRNDLIIETGGHTSYSILLDPTVSDRTILHYPGANATFEAGEIDPAAWGGVRLVHFGYPPLMKRFYQDDGRSLEALYRSARRQGAITSLDMALVEPDSEAGRIDWDAYLARVLSAVDVFLPSFEEIVFMLRRTSYLEHLAAAREGESIFGMLDSRLLGQLADELLTLGPLIVGIKLGEHGMYLKTAADRARWAAWGSQVGLDPQTWCGMELYMPCYEVKVNGTTGAGDAAIAGFLAALLHGEDSVEALRSAAAVGAHSVSGLDSVGGIPAWEELKHWMSRRHPQRASALSGSGWRHDADRGVWIGPRTMLER
ncbi:MAG: sugar kinase, ribokinase [Paenibacillus sp.]|jgi:sugar/nucleoside kinase (ribokinase family)|nr:sugar kinase, ribokinase [Paenibacillus sp.]